VLTLVLLTTHYFWGHVHLFLVDEHRVVLIIRPRW